VTTAEISAEGLEFANDGFVIVRALLSPEETDLLGRIARRDKQLADSAYGRKDASGQNVTLALRNDLEEDIYSAIARSQRVAGRMSEYLGDEVYHYHHKLILKEPRVGGYWYYNGCLLPDMGSCMIAIDRATKENGCLQVLKGSQAMGRIDHGRTGDQTGADLERVEVARQRFELVHVELEPGDAVFFHANLLHRSDQNRSENARWTLICCYNTRRKNPYKESRHPRYSPLEVLPDDQLLPLAEQQWAKLSQD